MSEDSDFIGTSGRLACDTFGSRTTGGADRRADSDFIGMSVLAFSVNGEGEAAEGCAVAGRPGIRRFSGTIGVALDVEIVSSALVPSTDGSVEGVIGRDRLKRVAARVLPFFSAFTGVSIVTGLDIPDRVPPTALRMRDIGPAELCTGGVGAGSGETEGDGDGRGEGGVPIRGGLTFSEMIFGVNCFLNTLSRCSFNARSELKKLGET